MGWEYRGERTYYYRKVRQGRRVVSLYCGAGEDGYLAELRADLECSLRTDAACRRVAEQEEEREDAKRLEHAIIDAVTLIDTVFKLAMGTKGFIYHHRAWRKGRPKMDIESIINESIILAYGIDEFLTAHKVRRLFDEDRDGSLVARHGGDMAGRTMEILITEISDDPYQREAIRRTLAQQRADLGAKTAIERLLVERILLAWLECSYCDRKSVATIESATIGVGVWEGFASQSDYWSRRVGRVQRRLIQALKALETVRAKALLSASTIKVDVVATTIAAEKEDASQRASASDDRLPKRRADFQIRETKKREAKNFDDYFNNQDEIDEYACLLDKARFGGLVTEAEKLRFGDYERRFVRGLGKASEDRGGNP